MRATPLAKILIERIRAGGPLCFAEYMDACLYHTEHGYYSRLEAARFADYYTSVDVHPIFGRLLARQLAEMWELLGKPRKFIAVELGAGLGRLAAHILSFSARALPDFFRALHYVAVERSVARRAVIQKTLGESGPVTAASELPEGISHGCVFSNEFFDALPVHRVEWERNELREIYVDAADGILREVSGPPSSPRLAKYFSELGVALGEGQQAEAGLEACRWIADASIRLGRGFVLTIDYGDESAQLCSARHRRGTLMAYENHRASENLYAAPGEQDLTAHVNFSALELLPCQPHNLRLATSGLVTQTRFLLALGRANEFADLYEGDEDERKGFQARQGLQTLIHPEGMGEMFKVLIQHKGIDTPRLTGLAPL